MPICACKGGGEQEAVRVQRRRRRLRRVYIRNNRRACLMHLCIALCAPGEDERKKENEFKGEQREKRGNSNLYLKR